MERQQQGCGSQKQNYRRYPSKGFEFHYLLDFSIFILVNTPGYILFSRLYKIVFGYL